MCVRESEESEFERLTVRVREREPEGGRMREG
jgi:hypothetical protein